MKKILISLVLIAGGVIFLVISSQQKARLSDPSYEKLEATICDFTIDDTDSEHTSTTAYVNYTLDGETKKAQLDSYSSSMRIGNTIEILVDPLNPTYAYVNSKAGYRMSFGFGIFCFVAAVLSFFAKGRNA